MKRLLTLALFLLGCTDYLPTPPEPALASVPAASWGLDRIDQRALPLDGTYSTPFDGTGVTVYVVDLGLLYGHPEFHGRASFGFDYYGGDGADCFGHGTGVGAVAGGSTVGVAPGVSLVSVKVSQGCDHIATPEALVAALDWIAADVSGPAVVNISVSLDSVAPVVDQAVDALAAAGVLSIMSAGNTASDACARSPGRAASGLMVGATGQTDERASFSNWGSCVDLFAPGQGILTANISGGYQNETGTSFAAPHVTGVAALYLQAHPNASAAEVRDSVLGYASKLAVRYSDSPNPALVYARPEYMAPVPLPDPLPAPSGLTVQLTGTRKTGNQVQGQLTWTWNPVVGAEGYRFGPAGAPFWFITSFSQWLPAGTHSFRVAAVAPFASSPLVVGTVTLCTSNGGKNGQAWLC